MTDDDLELPLFPEAGSEVESEDEPALAPPSQPSRRGLAAPAGGAAPPPPRVPPMPQAPPVHPAGLGRRLLGGLLDLTVMLGVLVALIVGTAWLEVQIGLADWPAMLLFVLAFSFLYTVVPLAFWGRTPGMVVVGIIARSPGDRPLSFGQTLMRWVGSLLTVALLGLPTLLVVFGASLADRLSGSAVLVREE